MIFGSIGLVLVAFLLLALGLGQGSGALYAASIVASLLAAGALLVAVRGWRPAGSRGPAAASRRARPVATPAVGRAEVPAARHIRPD